MEVFLAEERNVWLHCVEELGDHSGHATEMSRAASAFEWLGQLPNFDMGIETGGVHGIGSWGVHSGDTALAATLEILCGRTWVMLEVVATIELQRVHEDADHHNVAHLLRFVDEHEVAVVQSAHRGDEPDGLVVAALRAAPSSHRRRRLKNKHRNVLAQWKLWASSGQTPSRTSAMYSRAAEMTVPRRSANFLANL